MFKGGREWWASWAGVGRMSEREGGRLGLGVFPYCWRGREEMIAEDDEMG